MKVAAAATTSTKKKKLVFARSKTSENRLQTTFKNVLTLGSTPGILASKNTFQANVLRTWYRKIQEDGLDLLYKAINIHKSTHYLNNVYVKVRFTPNVWAPPFVMVLLFYQKLVFTNVNTMEELSKIQIWYIKKIQFQSVNRTLHSKYSLKSLVDTSRTNQSKE